MLAEPQEVFTFVHPNRDTNIDNTRTLKMSFDPLPDMPSATCHGFVGYFDSKLYGDVHISTYPPTQTPGMFSWFPIYFPLKDPIHVPAGRKVECQMWRCVSSSKVWYEWAVTSPVVSHIHNLNGRSSWVGL
jgi:protein arginine N-methyltransferase 5